MSSEFNEKNHSLKMEKTIISFKKDISTLRTGRANASMLDMIKVDVYGQLMPVNQIGTVSVPEARMISIQVWDQSNIEQVDAAILAKQHAVEENVVEDSNKDKGEEVSLRGPPLSKSYQTEGEFPEFAGVADCHAQPVQRHQGQVAAHGVQPVQCHQGQVAAHGEHRATP